MNWFIKLSIRWKFQLGFFIVTMVTTIFNRLMASHELLTMIEIAIQFMSIGFVAKLFLKPILNLGEGCKVNPLYASAEA